MKMQQGKILNLVPGTPEWHALRAKRFTASEAPAMMRKSKYQSRGELLEQKATGITSDVSPQQQQIFDRGHAAEAAARPIAEKIIGEELYPCVLDDEEGGFLASMDGLTMLGTVAWEHKLWSESLAAQVKAGELEEHYTIQLDQQLALSGADKVMFMCSDGTEDRCEWMWYERDESRFKPIESGWAQFRADLAEYKPAEPVTGEVVAASLVDLPAVRVQVTGSIEVADNFRVFEDALRDFIDNKLVRDPKTDQDFADLDSQIKSLKKAEEALKAAEGQILSQVEAVDQAKRTKDMLATLARDNRLMAEKLLAERKKSIKIDIATAARQSVDQHIEKLNSGLEDAVLPKIITDFNAAMKGKRTVATLQGAADDEVARAKIEATEMAERIRANLKTLADAGYEFLFADRQQLVEKDPDDLAAVVKARIADHEKAESERQEREREKIRAEEQRKVEQRQRHEQAEAQRRAEGKCDGNHGGPACADPECWNREENAAAPAESAPTTKTETMSATAAPRHKKPTDAEIIDAVAREFRVSEAVALRWITEIDLSAQQRALAS